MYLQIKGGTNERPVIKHITQEPYEQFEKLDHFDTSRSFEWPDTIPIMM